MYEQNSSQSDINREIKSHYELSLKNLERFRVLVKDLKQWSKKGQDEFIRTIIELSFYLQFDASRNEVCTYYMCKTASQELVPFHFPKIVLPL